MVQPKNLKEVCQKTQPFVVKGLSQTPKSRPNKKPVIDSTAFFLRMQYSVDYPFVSAHLCSREKFAGHDYCLRHILEDRSAPFKQCGFTFTKTQGPNNPPRRCPRPAPKADRKDGYCVEHSRKALMARQVNMLKNPPLFSLIVVKPFLQGTFFDFFITSREAAKPKRLQDTVGLVLLLVQERFSFLVMGISLF